MSNRPVAWVKLEEDAYYAVLRALAVSELNWEKEKLLTDLRTALHITNDQHFKFLEEVMGDKLVNRLRSGAGSAEGNKAAGGNAGSMPPPPPRQHTPAGANNPRKHSRPGSSGQKQAPSTAPAPHRSHRSERDLKRHSSSGGLNRGLQHSRNRGRGRRITALPREQPVAQIISKPRVTRKMFAAEYVKKIKQKGTKEEASALYADLQAQLGVIDHHISLINRLDDDSLAERDPARFCQLAIEELELAQEDIMAEEAYLKSSDDEDEISED